MRAARTPGHTILMAALIAVAAVALVHAVIAEWAHAEALPRVDRIALLHASMDDRVRAAAPDAFTAWKTLDGLVPTEATLVCAFHRTPENVRTYYRLQALLAPRLLVMWVAEDHPAGGADIARDAVRTGSRVYIADFATGLPPAISQLFDRASTTPALTVWKPKPAGS